MSGLQEGSECVPAALGLVGCCCGKGPNPSPLGVTAEPSEVSSQGWPAVVMSLHFPLQVLRTGAPFLFPQMWVSQARQSHRSHSLHRVCTQAHTQEAHRCTHAHIHTKQPQTLQMGCGDCLAASGGRGNRFVQGQGPATRVFLVVRHPPTQKATQS